MEKIKVLETIRQGSVGGGESHVLDLVGGLNKELFDPVVLSFTEGPMVDRLQEMGIKTHVISTLKPFDFRVFGQVKKLMKQEGIQLLHAHGTRACSNTYYPAKQLNIPLIYTVHGWSFHDNQKEWIRRIRILGERLLVKRAAVTVCVSDSNLKEGSNYFEFNKSTVIKNGINQVRFNPEKSFKDVRAELGVGKEEVLVGFIARVTLQKNPLLLIRAFAKIAGTHPIKLLIVGDGDLKKDAVDLAAALKVEDKIIFQPFRQDIPDLLNAIDIYCLPSLWEGLSIALLEAMGMRKAIVATPVNGTKEVITHMKNGILVPVNDVDALADAFVQLANDPSLRSQIAQQAYETLSQEFNTQTMVHKIEDLYTQVSTNHSNKK
ncbi:glycosyltransferase family 4 protein [Niabella sp. CJ426]|uniref:glycosyltransferase family 4 protein n=1 Tax=Niabella sp. CJ426 TaxID=3393740 RepID=UPI003D0479A8